MGGDGEHRIGDAGVPRNTGITRDVRSAVDVPEPSEVAVVARLLPPGGVGDDVAVLAQEGLDHLEDARMADGPLHEAAPIEHLVTERCRLLGGVPTVIGWVFLEDPFDLGAER